MTTVSGFVVRGGPRQAPPGTPVVVRWLLAAAILAGLLAMHALSSLDPAGMAASASGVSAVHDRHGGMSDADSHPAAERHTGCPGNHEGGGQPCPGDHGGHTGPTCQSGAVQTGAAAGIPGSAVDVTATAAESRPGVSPSTTAHSAAGGSGCGPPSLVQLSISRT